MKGRAVSALVVTLVLASSSVGAQTIFRCKDSNGRTSFQHQPCADSVPQQTAPARGTAPASNHPRAQSSTAAPATRPQRAPITLGPPSPPSRIQFSLDPREDYMRAASWLDSIRSMGSNCRAALNAGSDGASLTCRRFLDKLAPGAEYQQVDWRLKVLDADESARIHRRVHRAGIQRAMDEIRLHQEFVQATIGRGN